MKNGTKRERNSEREREARRICVYMYKDEARTSEKRGAVRGNREISSKKADEDVDSREREKKKELEGDEESSHRSDTPRNMEISAV